MIIIFDYNRTIFNPETNSLYDGVLKLLESLYLNHSLVLVSKDELGREVMLKNMGIAKYFINTIFVKEKTVEVFKSLVKNDEKILVVGDRVRGEICIGNQLGFITIWVAQGKFANEIPQNENEIPNHTIEEIKQLNKIIKIYE
jgi:FMN phosphatase YigB (HAD superfamily)